MLQRCLNTIGCQLRLTQACSVLIALTVATASSLSSNRDNILRHHEEHIKHDSARIQQAYDNAKRLPIQQQRAALGRILKELSSHDHTYWINTADGDTILPAKGNNQIEQQTLTTIRKAYTQPRPSSNWIADTSQLKQSLDERAKIESREYAVFNHRQLSYFASLWVAQDITEHIRFQQDLLNSSIITLLGCISLSLLTSSMLTRRIIQPLQQLSSAAATINTRSTDHLKLPTTTSSKEVGDLTTALNSLLARLESSLSQQRTFTHSVSHELRGPLMILNLCNRRLARELGESAANHRDTLRIQRRELVRMEHIVNDLLSMFKAGDAINQQALEPINVAALLDTTIESIRHASPHPIELNREASTTHESRAWWALGHQDQLEQVVVNLIGNAQKYSTHQQPIRVDLRARWNQLAISIEDRGIGISASDQEHIFEPFFRGSNTGGIEGTGLGLPVVKALVEAMGGSVQVWSEPLHGTRFTIVLQRHWPSPSGPLQGLAQGAIGNRR
jgi:signal transduction histidine kinase